MRIKFVWLTTVLLISATAFTAALWNVNDAPTTVGQSLAEAVAVESSRGEPVPVPPAGTRPVVETKTKLINYTVIKPVYEKHQKEISYTVMKPVYETKEKTVTYTVCTMVPETKTKTVEYTTCRMVPEAKQKTVEYQEVRYVPINASESDSK